MRQIPDSHGRGCEQPRAWRSRLTWIVLLGLALALAWRVTDTGDSSDDTSTPNATDDPDSAPWRAMRGRSNVIVTPPTRLTGGAVTISGRVIEADTVDGDGVGNVEVVFRGDGGESTTMTAEDGSYRIEVPVATYRAFVRDDSVLSVGRVERIRLPDLPDPDHIGAPDEALMPLVVANRDLTIDLTVVRGGVVTGKITDRAGRPIPRAVVRAARNGIRPALGTDTAETDANGMYELRLPEGAHDLQATHPRYAGPTAPPSVYISVDEPHTLDIQLIAGCVISGRVVGADGKPAGEGAIERSWAGPDTKTLFAPDGKIAADGSFRWVTIDQVDITLRAWPWKSPPSEAHSFACREGTRFDDVVFKLPPNGPDLAGVLVDASGAPVPFAFLDLAPLDPGGLAQQERSDADGNWAVFSMPAGRYQVTAYSPGRGHISTVVTAPSQGVKIALGGLGRLEGTTPLLADGSFEAELLQCSDESPVNLDAERRLVAVTNGKFVIDNLPACHLHMRVTWRHSVTEHAVVVAENGTVALELPIGPPRAKHISGVIRDPAGRPVETAYVQASHDNGESLQVVTESDGRYQLDTFAGARITVWHDPRRGYAQVSFSIAANEQIDIKLVDDAPDEPIENLQHDSFDSFEGGSE